MVKRSKFRSKLLEIRLTLCFESIRIVVTLTSVWIIRLSNTPANPSLKILPTYYYRNPKTDNIIIIVTNPRRGISVLYILIIF